MQVSGTDRAYLSGKDTLRKVIFDSKSAHTGTSLYVRPMRQIARTAGCPGYFALLLFKQVTRPLVALPIILHLSFEEGVGNCRAKNESNT